MTSMPRLTLFLLAVASVRCQESAQYLRNAVRDLRKLNLRPTLVRADTAMATAPPSLDEEEPEQPPVERRVQHGTEAPPLTLTKGELAALYESAIAKGETLHLDGGDNTFIHTAIHEIGGDNAPLVTKNEDTSGYYYYYYPIKSFIDEMTSQASSNLADFTHKSKKPKDTTTTHRPHYQYHSHHHQHNITISKEMTEDKKPKTLEPLFMAISGFIGMAVMFVLSMIVLPKFGSKPSKKGVWAKRDEHIEDFARLALNAIDGNDCTERFACELSKTARTFNLQDNRFVKLLKRMAPGTFGKHMDKAGKFQTKMMKCTAIPCKKKNNKNVANKNQPKQKKKNAAQKKH
ncbi:hypothetical protein JTB14_028070 [Gonioctena quinquepunctata]|nr:hypothetical protein JTB14_028070 [Gonioctena quinquepunctata]